MSTAHRYFHVVGMPDFPSRADVSFLGSTGGEPVGITDIRFPSPGWLLRKSWPGLRHDVPDASPSLLTGERLTEDLVGRLKPVRVELRAALAERRAFPKQLPDWIVVAGVPVISKRAMDVIETIEPRRHQFFPVKFEAWDTREPLYSDQQYGYLNVLNWIAPDAFYDIEAMGGFPEASQSEVRLGSDADEAFTAPVMSTRLSLQEAVFDFWQIRPDWIAAGHLISTGSYSKNRFSRVSAASLVFASDALLAELTKRLSPDAFRAKAIPVSRR